MHTPRSGLMTPADKTKLAGIEASADVTDAVNVASSIHGVVSKATPVNADEIGLVDSAASNVLKKLTWVNLKTTLKTYFDTLYDTIGGLATHAADTSTHGVTGTILGTEDRDVVDGIAGLDASGNILSKGPNLILDRGAGSLMYLKERTTGNQIVMIFRTGNNNYELSVKASLGWHVIQHAGMKNIANGIAGLDASADVPLAQIPDILTGKDADTLDTKHYSDISSEIDSDIATHAADTSTHGVTGTILGTEDKDVANGIAGLNALGNVSGLFLSVSDFQTNAATGTASSPFRVNNGSLGADTGFTINEYVDVVFPQKSYISEYRHYGSADMNGDGTYKIQHWNGSEWMDNTTNIPTRVNSWSSWTLLTTPIFTEKIRIVATVIDTYTENQIYELEMRG